LTCPASTAAALLQGKWRVHILCMMRGGPVRLGQLSRLLPEASKKVLMTELKQLVASGLVERRDLSNGSVVRHVEYNLIDSIRPATFLLLTQLEIWALAWESADTNGNKKR
jgi:DNA-binding HxlR family transcriptional regulator